MFSIPLKSEFKDQEKMGIPYDYHLHFENFTKQSFLFLFSEFKFKHFRVEHASMLSICSFISELMTIDVSFEWRDRIGEVTINTKKFRKRLFEFFPDIFPDRNEKPKYYSKIAITSAEIEACILQLRDALIPCMPYLTSLSESSNSSV